MSMQGPWPALPNAYSLRMAQEIDKARNAPITEAEIAELAADHDLTVAEVAALAKRSGMSLRETAGAARALRAERTAGETTLHA